MDTEDVPAFIDKSSVVVMSRDRSERVVDHLEISYGRKRIKITEIMPVSYCSENEESIRTAEIPAELSQLLKLRTAYLQQEV